MKEKRVYISGAITGVERDEVKRRFSRAESFLSSIPNVIAVNPLNNGLPDDASWAEHMLRDLDMLSGCDAVYVLFGSRNSSGVSVELAFSRGLGLPEFYEIYHDAGNLSAFVKYGSFS